MILVYRKENAQRRPGPFGNGEQSRDDLPQMLLLGDVCCFCGYRALEVTGIAGVPASSWF